jgi:hypothetical protein
VSLQELQDRPCQTCRSRNHGTGAHEKLVTLYHEHRTTVEARLRTELMTTEQRDDLVRYLSMLNDDIARLNRRPSRSA